MGFFTFELQIMTYVVDTVYSLPGYLVYEWNKVNFENDQKHMNIKIWYYDSLYAYFHTGRIGIFYNNDFNPTVYRFFNYISNLWNWKFQR